MIKGALSRGRAGQVANILGLTPGGNPQDTMLAHITPAEAGALSRMSGGMKVNPVSGLPAFYGEGDGGAGEVMPWAIAQFVGPGALNPAPPPASEPQMKLMPRTFQPFAADASYGKPGGTAEHLFFRSPGQEAGSQKVGGGALSSKGAGQPTGDPVADALAELGFGRMKNRTGAEYDAAAVAAQMTPSSRNSFLALDEAGRKDWMARSGFTPIEGGALSKPPAAPAAPAAQASPLAPWQAAFDRLDPVLRNSLILEAEAQRKTPLQVAYEMGYVK